MMRTKPLEIITSKGKSNGKMRNMGWLKYTENDAGDKHKYQGNIRWENMLFVIM